MTGTVLVALLLIGSLTSVLPDPRGPIYALVDSEQKGVDIGYVTATATFKSYTMVYSPYWDFFILRIEGYSAVSGAIIDMAYLGCTIDPTGTGYPPGGFDWELSAYQNIVDSNPDLPYWIIDQPGEFLLEFKVWPLDADGNKMDLEDGYYRWEIEVVYATWGYVQAELYAE